MKSFIEIDGLRIEGNSGLVVNYILAVKNALREIHDGKSNGVWVHAEGYYTVTEDGRPETRVKNTQSVHLHAHSKVRYQIVEDEHSAPLYDDGTLGDAGKVFLDKYADLSELVEDADDEGDAL